MDINRPLKEYRPVGPLAQRTTSSHDGIHLNYTVSNDRELPTNNALEEALNELYKEARADGESKVVAAGVDVGRCASPHASRRIIKVDTGVAVMTMDQLDKVESKTTQLMKDNGADIEQIAISIP